MLYLISTPIGNLKDITPRALETLAACDYVLCEDTRRTRILLNHYSIKAHLKSFHLFNEASKENRVIEDLNNSMEIGLVSDAGTPGISDPGERLVKRCRAEQITVIPIPGPCAAIAALCASGLVTTRFQFFGFLPRKKGKLTKALDSMLLFPGTTICYESPYRIAPTLKVLAELDPERECVVAREITKKFETFVKGSALTLFEKYHEAKPKGEIVLLISGIEK
ncbi:MAG: Ribosomal RNA small subunit methyltransferase I [Chlamydiales bacterium]|nr:Ribosomal RNA small subunit methyltransferase I [Chlamydiales bacterium]